MTWTKEQGWAISSRNCDLLVSAAAGSGKTAVLVERIISLITDEKKPVDVDRLLVVTFTKAAASEMNQRIGQAIAEKLKLDPGNVHLQNQMTLLSRADIKTIHAFCLQVIKENYFLLDMDPSARTADQTEIKLLQREVLNDLFESYYEDTENPEFYQLVEQFGGGTRDTGLKDLILRIYNFIQGDYNPVSWLKKMEKCYDIGSVGEMDATIWMPTIKKAIFSDISEAISLIKEALKLTQSIAGLEGYQKTLEKELHMLEAFPQNISNSFEEIYQEFGRIQFGRLSPYRGEDTEIADKIKDLRNQVKKIITTCKDKYLFFRPQYMAEHVEKLYGRIQTLVQIVIAFHENFQKAKREKQILDFSDYEHLCLKILLEEGSTPDCIIPSAVACDIQRKYEEVLVDEYQDSNMIQEMILSAVSRKSLGHNNRFMVGDVKQSIYRFRLAMPEIFLKKYQLFSNFSLEETKKEKKIILGKNFRSRANVLEGINFLFRQIMTEELGELSYDEDAALYPGLEFLPTEALCGGANEILLMDYSDNPDLDITMEEWNKKELEAAMIAKKIHEMMKDGFHVWDKERKKYRPLQYCDITILMRGIRSWNGVFEKVFQEENIPFFMDSSLGYLHTTEVVTILSLLQIIDNPRQDIPLLCVLHSPIFGFTSETLADIRLEGGDGGFWECLMQYHAKYKEGSEAVDYETANKITKFLEDLHQWRETAANYSIRELLWELYHQTGYFDYVGITSGGMVRQGNLRFLIEKAEQYENTSMKGLFHFVKYIENIKKAEEEEGSAKLLSESENLVRVMTIHKSKGLEFPVVFVADMGKEFNMKDSYSDVILHQKLGIGLSYADIEGRVRYPSLPKAAIAETIRIETLSEELRVLYVALTRAKEKLILSGCINNLEKKISIWMDAAGTAEPHISEFYRKKAKNYLDWVMPALLRHPKMQSICIEQEIPVISTNSQWNYTFYHKEDFYNENLQKQENRNLAKDVFSFWNTEIDYSGKRQEIFSSLQWEYPHRKATTLPGKLSISEIKRRQRPEYDTEQYFYNDKTSLVFKEPQKILNKEFSGAEFGTIMHTFMEYADLTKCYTENVLEEQIDTLVSQKILSLQEAEMLNRKALLQFFSSSLAERMRSAKKIEKEHPFSILLMPRELFSEEQYYDIEENILVNGIIDCFFYEDNGIVLVDYKSDKVSETILKQKYGLQLSIYREALERTTLNTVDECYIYSFYLGKAIKM